ncbi:MULTISPECIES: AraC family transcriptional regulator [unclassified Streptomyces]|uniref:helix-turn-helix transcriptional regulator n=1 Tax=unclassified Streptomyces TaxID=2593676 RepID=UPI0003A98EB9|nr:MULTISPECIES: AraC family transcriptional regulator [unclassified Streptomyces]
MEDALVTRVMVYVRRHLTEPDLTPERIAREHAVSRRRLCTVLARAGISLEQWIIGARLEAACRLLADPRHAGLPVASVAARCGFASPSHFGRRFRAAHGGHTERMARTTRAHHPLKRRCRPRTRAAGPPRARRCRRPGISCAGSVAIG